MINLEEHERASNTKLLVQFEKENKKNVELQIRLDQEG
jgi:hypothetical protein